MIHPDYDFATVFCVNCGFQITIPVYCGNRFCPDCNGKRRTIIRQKLDAFTADRSVTKGVTFKFLTLTVKSQADLKAMVGFLLKSFRRLRQRKLWKDKVFGGAFVIEMKVNDGLWHAHIHAVIEGYYIEWDKLLACWESITGSTGVYIKMIPVKAITGYLTKYITKTDLSEEHQIEASTALKGKRLFQPFGTWHNGFPPIESPKKECKCCGKAEWFYGTVDMFLKTCERIYEMPERGPPEDTVDDIRAFYNVRQYTMGFEKYVLDPT